MVGKIVANNKEFHRLSNKIFEHLYLNLNIDERDRVSKLTKATRWNSNRTKVWIERDEYRTWFRICASSVFFHRKIVMSNTHILLFILCIPMLPMKCLAGWTCALLQFRFHLIVHLRQLSASLPLSLPSTAPICKYSGGKYISQLWFRSNGNPLHENRRRKSFVHDLVLNF